MNSNGWSAACDIGAVTRMRKNGCVTDALFEIDAAGHPCFERIVTDGTDRVEWLRARARGITATDVAKLSTLKSIETAAYVKLNGTGFGGNAFTDHGRAREPEIAAWVRERFEIEPSAALFRAASNPRHLATPDGLVVRADGTLELSEIKTTNKAWAQIPKNYLRQIWWQQYVLGADRTLLVWEQHKDFVPLSEPEFRWIERDDREIERLVSLANQLIDRLVEITNR